MFLATLTSIPDRKYRVVGMVIGSDANISTAIQTIIREAEKLGGDGIIGLSFIPQNGIITVVGTAIKFIVE